MLSSLIQNGFLYSKPLISEIQSAVFPTEGVLDIPEAESLWGWHKNKDDEEEETAKEKKDEVKDEPSRKEKEEDVREKLEPARKPKHKVPEASEDESEEEAEYKEMRDADIKAMLEAYPMEPAEEGWDRDLPIMVVPVTFSQFMDCFWADSAPYFIPAWMRSDEDVVVNYTNWSEPTEDAKFVFGDDVISIRKIEKKVHTTAKTRLYTAPHVIQYIALMEQSDVSATIFVMQTQYGAPYASSHQEWFKWEIMSPDPRSYRTALRQQAAVQWGKDSASKPWVVWKVIEKWEVADIKSDNDEIEAFINLSANRCVAGKNYYKSVLPEMEPVPSEVI